MIKIAENILQKNWEFRSGNYNERPIKITEIPGGFRIENVNQNRLNGFFYPLYTHELVNPFPVGVSLTLKCSISTSVRLMLTGEPSEFYFDLVAQEAAEALRVETVSVLTTTDRLTVNLVIGDLPVGEWLEITDPHFFLSTEKPDIWTPAHDDLTPEQIATLPPYGKYKEIKSF